MVKVKVDNAFMRTDSYGREWEYYKTDVGSKMRYHYEKHCPQTAPEKRAFFLITAYQPEQDAAAHKQQTDLLAKDIRAAGLGVIRVLGCYQDTAQQREITAESFFVPLPKDFDVQSFLQYAASLCKAYAQETVLINIPEHTDFGYYSTNGALIHAVDEPFSYDEQAVGGYFAGLFQRGSENNTVQWLAVRHPQSVPQAVLMSQNKENLHMV